MSVPWLITSLVVKWESTLMDLSSLTTSDSHCLSELRGVYVSAFILWIFIVCLYACLLLSKGSFVAFLTACRMTTHTHRPDISGDNGCCVNEKCMCPLHLFIKKEDFSAGMPSGDVALTCQAARRHFTHKVFNKTSKQHNSNSYK